MNETQAQLIKQNLDNLCEFVSSKLYENILQMQYECEYTKEWYDMFELTRESMNFFFEISPIHPRVLRESQYLVKMIDNLTTAD